MRRLCRSMQEVRDLNQGHKNPRHPSGETTLICFKLYLTAQGLVSNLETLNVIFITSELKTTAISMLEDMCGGLPNDDNQRHFRPHGVVSTHQAHQIFDAGTTKFAISLGAFEIRDRKT